MMQDIFIHHSAEVSSDANISSGVKIWNWTKVRENTFIGEFVSIGQCVYIDVDVVIGDRCKIQNNAQLYKGVVLEEDVFIGPNVTFTNDKYPRAHNKNWKVTNTYIKKGASIGAGSTILCGVTIGKHAMVAAGSVVTKNVEDHALVAGNPARILGMIDRDGKRIFNE